MQAPRDREALFSHTDSWLEEGCPGQSAVVLMRHVEHLEDARHTHRAPTNDRVRECQRLAMHVEEVVRCCRCWRCLTTIKRHHFGPIMEQQQGPTTNA